MGVLFNISQAASRRRHFTYVGKRFRSKFINIWVCSSVSPIEISTTVHRVSPIRLTRSKVRKLTVSISRRRNRCTEKIRRSSNMAQKTRLRYLQQDLFTSRPRLTPERRRFRGEWVEAAPRRRGA